MTGALPLHHDDKPAPTAWEQAAAGLILILLTGALIGPIFAPLQQETPALRLIWPPVYLVILGLAGVRARRMAAAWPAFIPVMLMIGLALASSLWSLAPDVSQRRVIALTLTSGFAVYLGVAFDDGLGPVLMARPAPREIEALHALGSMSRAANGLI